MSIVQFLFSAKGRIRRRDYWLFSLVFVVLLLLLEFGGHQILTGHPAGDFFKDLSNWMSLKPEPFNVFMLALSVLVLWPSICVAAKRWHDRNRPGYMAGAVMVLNYVLIIPEIYYGPQGSHLNWPIYGVSAFIGFVIAIWVFVECGCLDGTKGPNKYGPSPKGIAGPADVF